MIREGLGRFALAGVLATAMMDLGSAVLRRTGLISGLAPSLIGRWFAYLARGQFSHHTITQSPAVRAEIPTALAGHYLIGITLAVMFCTLLLSYAPTPAQAMLLALGFGALTNALPWLWMFPSMGFGPFGTGAPSEWLLLRSSLVNHLVFGAGLALSTRWLGIFAGCHGAT